MDFLMEKCREEKKPFKLYLYKYFVLGCNYVEYFKNFRKVSKSHASLTYHNQSWFVEDIGSKTGVYINMSKIGRYPVKLNYWDLLGLGGPTMDDDVFFCVLCPKLIDMPIRSLEIFPAEEEKDSDISLKEDKGMMKREAVLEDTEPYCTKISDFFQVVQDSSHSSENDIFTFTRTREKDDAFIYLKEDRGMIKLEADLEDTQPGCSKTSDSFQAAGSSNQSSDSAKLTLTHTREDTDSDVHLKDQKGMKKRSINLKAQQCSSRVFDFSFLKNNSVCSPENDLQGCILDNSLNSSESYSRGCSLDDDADDACSMQSSSSVESMNIVMYPSPSVLAKIEATKKAKQSRLLKGSSSKPETLNAKKSSKTSSTSKNSEKNISTKRGRKKSNSGKQDKDSPKANEKPYLCGKGKAMRGRKKKIFK